MPIPDWERIDARCPDCGTPLGVARTIGDPRCGKCIQDERWEEFLADMLKDIARSRAARRRRAS